MRRVKDEEVAWPIRIIVAVPFLVIVLALLVYARLTDHPYTKDLTKELGVGMASSAAFSVKDDAIKYGLQEAFG